MGSLAACILAGVPKQLVIPCLPHNASFGGKGHGKAPASYDPVSTMWGALDEWQLGGLDGEIQQRPRRELFGGRLVAKLQH